MSATLPGSACSKVKPDSGSGLVAPPPLKPAGGPPAAPPSPQSACGSRLAAVCAPGAPGLAPPTRLEPSTGLWLAADLLLMPPGGSGLAAPPPAPAPPPVLAAASPAAPLLVTAACDRSRGAGSWS